MKKDKDFRLIETPVHFDFIEEVPVQYSVNQRQAYLRHRKFVKAMIENGYKIEVRTNTVHFSKGWAGSFWNEYTKA